MNQRVLFIATLALGLAVLIAIFVANVIRQQPNTRFVTVSRNIMATPISVTTNDADIVEASTAVFDVFERVDQMMSEWKPGSPLASVNDAAGDHPVKVPDELFRVIQRGIEIGDLTDGAFDITWAALWGVWDFISDDPQLPDTNEIRQRLDLIDSRQIVLDPEKQTVYLPHKGMLIGLGGIAKGTALNLAVDELHARGIDNFLITAGGQVITSGRRHDRPWRIGIRDPRGEASEYFARLELTNESSATSGDYERYFILDDTRYHHILDPRTGYPSSELRSATVICQDAELADALSTALMVMGKDKGLQLIANLDEVEALVVDTSGTIIMSDGLKDCVDIVHPPG